MAYTIYKSNGTAVTISDNTIDTQFYSPNVNGTGKGVGTQIVGRNAIDYGSPIAQNFLQLTENFAGPNSPPSGKALKGQLWFDSGVNALKVNTGTTAAPVWNTVSTVADPGAVTGSDGQVKVVGSTIFIWANGAWRQIFPAVYS